MLGKVSQIRVNPADETFSHDGVAVHFLLTGEQSGGSIAAFEVTVPGSKRLLAPAHSHDHFEETIYGVEGTLTWTVDGHRHDVGPGQALCIPRGAVHRFDNNGAHPAKVLCVVTPAAIGPEYFREAFAVLNAAAGGPRSREDDGNHAPPRPDAGTAGIIRSGARSVQNQARPA